MVVSLVNTAEGLTDGTVPTTGNTGGASGTAASSVTVSSPDTLTASNARSAHGGICYKYLYSASPAAITRIFWPAVESGRLVLSFYVYFDETSIGAIEDLGGIRASSNMGSIGITVSGKLYVANTSGTSVPSSSSTANFPLQQWVHTQMAITKGTTTSNGRIEWAYSLGDSSTLIQTFDSGATVNTGTVDTVTVYAGRTSNRTVANDVYIDTVRAQSLASGWLSPYSIFPPLKSAFVNQALTNSAFY